MRGLDRSMLACALPVFMGAVGYGGEQPSEEAWALGMREVCVTTWPTFMVPGGGLCPSAPACGSAEERVPVCDGWGGGGGRCGRTVLVSECEFLCCMRMRVCS